MKLRTTILAACIAFAGIATPAFAWDLLGTREVRDRTDTDQINLPGDRHFNRIRLCVYRQPVHFIDVDVYFKNGGHQDISVAERINPGGCTRALNLEGANRNIERIKMKYEETSFKRRTATVRVFGE